MKAVVQHKYGAPERVLRLEEVERPPYGDDDVLVRVRATSVNTPDWITVTGVPYILRLRSGLRRPREPVRGTDVAGIVEAVGNNVADLQRGDELFGSRSDSSRSARRGCPPTGAARWTRAPRSCSRGGRADRPVRDPATRPALTRK